jgi:oligopeptide transport system permease protein
MDNQIATAVQLTAADFIPIGAVTTEADKIVRPSLTFWADVWRRLKRNKPAMAGLAFIILVSLGALILPFLSDYAYTETNFAAANALPSAEHLFGADNMGRDLWTRVWVGGRVSVLVGFGGAILPSLIGIIVGSLCGFFGGKLDMIVMRLIDILLCIPNMIYVILIMLWFGAGPMSIVLAFAISGWMGSARGARGHVLRLKNQEYVLAARALGASPGRLMFRHLFPNYFGLTLVGITMSIPAAIFTEAYLSFLGLGVQAPMTSWGQLCQLGTASFKNYPFQLFFPALFISLYMLAFNMLGDGLRDALDPRLKD